ncbi:response regulator [Roseomonas sp. USHLN139]|uniref:response regulator n=1 Tax=Roseomonas sp. USHLN139 TaxID=3081298 RepID=UPI003B016705
MRGKPWPLLAAALVVLAVSLGLLVASQVSAQLHANRQAVWHSFRVADVTRALLSAVQDAETGQRGYILTERESYLGPYEAAESQVPELQRQLLELLAGNTAQRLRAERLQVLVDDKMAELAESLTLSRNQGFAAGRALVQTDRGRELMFSIRGAVESILAEQQAALGQQVEAADRTQDASLRAALGGIALSLGAILAGTLLLLRNNTRLKRTEAALAEQGAVLQATLDHIQDGVAAFDAGGALAACNRQFFTLLDFPQALMRIGTPFSAFLAIDRRRDTPVLAAPDRMRGPAGSGQQLSLSQAGRELEIYRNAMPEGGFVISCIDVTRRAQAEAILRQTQKMEAIGQLTGGVAHDFNNMLQVVSANLEMLGRALGPEHPGRRHLGHAVSGVMRGARLTAQLLAFARRQPLDPRVIQPGRLVREMADLLQRTLGERIAVEAVVAGGLWNTQVDPGQLENALLNLALNARDAMPEGGKLTIEVANAALDEAYAAGHLEVEPGQYVMLAVSDSGAGMAPAVMARVFEPFFSTKEEGQGTGLGLSQVYGFVKQSGGHVKLYSEPGQGTVVKLYLPRSRRMEDQLGPGAAGPVVGGSETILVVEDDAELREAVVEMLQGLGYRVLRAEHAEAALTVLSSGVQVDLLFTDVVMPGPVKTRELARRAQDMMPGLKVIYTSGYTANAIIHDGRLDEDVQLLSKPYRREDLARHLRRALGTAAPEPALLAAAAMGGGGEAAGAAGETAIGWPEGTVALVVEDDPLIRMNLVQMVEIMGLAPAEAGKAETALAWLDRNPRPALLITDLTLPGMDGIALAAEARRRHPGLPVLLATGHAEGSLAIPPELSEGLGFLGKPFAMLQLERALKALWAKTR